MSINEVQRLLDDCLWCGAAVPFVAREAGAMICADCYGANGCTEPLPLATPITAATIAQVKTMKPAAVTAWYGPQTLCPECGCWIHLPINGEQTPVTCQVCGWQLSASEEERS